VLAGVQELLLHPLPFLPPAEAAGKMVELVGQRFSVDQVAFCWYHSSPINLNIAHWTPRDGVSWFDVPAPVNLNVPIHDLSDLPMALAALSWEELGCPLAECKIFLGMPTRDDFDRLSESWKLFIPGIFAWCLKFEQTLTDQKLQALAEYAAGAGHEINNPLGSIIGRTSQLLKTETDPERRRLLETIGAQAYRIGDMIGDTMLFAHPPPPRMQPTSLPETVGNVLSKFQQELSQQQVQVDFFNALSIPVWADVTQLQIVVAELLRNALRALSERTSAGPSQLSIRCDFETRNHREGALLEMTDNGIGMSREEQQHCFEPFYSGRQAGRGLGFGLSKCWRIVQQHQGEISISSNTDQTQIRIWWPTNSEPQATQR